MKQDDDLSRQFGFPVVRVYKILRIRIVGGDRILKSYQTAALLNNTVTYLKDAWNLPSIIGSKLFCYKDRFRAMDNCHGVSDTEVWCCVVPITNLIEPVKGELIPRPASVRLSAFWCRERPFGRSRSSLDSMRDFIYIPDGTILVDRLWLLNRESAECIVSKLHAKSPILA